MQLSLNVYMKMLFLLRDFIYLQIYFWCTKTGFLKKRKLGVQTYVGQSSGNYQYLMRHRSARLSDGEIFCVMFLLLNLPVNLVKNHVWSILQRSSVQES